MEKDMDKGEVEDDDDERDDEAEEDNGDEQMLSRCSHRF